MVWNSGYASERLVCLIPEFSWHNHPPLQYSWAIPVKCYVSDSPLQVVFYLKILCVLVKVAYLAKKSVFSLCRGCNAKVLLCGLAASQQELGLQSAFLWNRSYCAEGTRASGDKCSVSFLMLSFLRKCTKVCVYFSLCGRCWEAVPHGQRLESLMLHKYSLWPFQRSWVAMTWT